MKKCISFVLTLCLIFSMVAIVPTFDIKADAAKSISGGTLNSAKFILDPGHGGSDPGACLGSRHEADDVLKVALRVGRLMIDSGTTVAFTRVTDVYDSPSEKASIANAGNFSYFCSIHRNAATGTAYGIETYSLSTSGTSYKMSQNVQDALVALGVWRNRGCKTANYTVLTNTNMPAILIELGFIDNTSDNKIFDNYFEQNCKAIATGLLKTVGLSLSDPKTVTAPSVTVGTAAEYNSSVSVSWGAVTNATSYKYKVVSYAGEMSATSAKTIVSETSTTGKSFSFTAPASGKYCKVTVTAVGPNNTKSTTKTVMLGPWASQPTNVGFIPINDINGDQWTTGGSTVWTSSIGKNFSAVWWTAALCTANSDGSYTVSAVYASGGSSKAVAISGTNIMIATHSSEANHQYMAAVKVGDKITLHGVYLDNNTIRGSGYALVNGGVKLNTGDFTVSAPTSVNYGEAASVSWSAAANATSYNYTVKNGSTTVASATGVTAKSITIPAQTTGTSLTVSVTAVGPVDTKTVTKTITLVNPAPTDITSGTVTKVTNGSTTAFKGFAQLTTVQQALAMFNEDNSYIRVLDNTKTEVSASAQICTGYTVSIFNNGVATVTYTLVINGDVDGNGAISSADYMAVSSAFKGVANLDGAYALAADINSDAQVTSSDYLALASHLQNVNIIEG